MMPSEVDEHLSVFDRLATVVSDQVSRAPFFVVCLAMVLIWPISFLFFDPDTAQLIINTTTTIVTFLMVALLQNTQHRSDLAIQHKLNALAEGLADLMDEDESLDSDQADLRAAVGLEGFESSG
jgi:low affinity Fe/Cu permease